MSMAGAGFRKRAAVRLGPAARISVDYDVGVGEDGEQAVFSGYDH